MSIRNGGSLIFYPPPLVLAPSIVSMVDPVVSYISLAVTLQYIWLLLYVIPCWHMSGSQKYGDAGVTLPKLAGTRSTVKTCFFPRRVSYCAKFVHSRLDGVD